MIKDTTLQAIKVWKIKTDVSSQLVVYKSVVKFTIEATQM